MIIKKYLPKHCYPGRTRQGEGRVLHYFSAIYADPDNWDDPQRCWELFVDINHKPSEREFGPWAVPLNGRAKEDKDERGYGSADFLVLRDGGIWQLVPHGYETWHAGKSILSGRKSCNKWCFGIEIIAAPQVSAQYGFTDPQYTGAAELCRDVPLNQIAGHDTVREQYIMAHPEDRGVQKKSDPGSSFNWSRFMDLVQPPYDLDGD